MVQQVIDVGAVANDRTGDTWRDSLTKVNSNETELFDFMNAQAFNFISQESDFPTQDATTITLESNQIYIPTADFSTAKRFVCEDGSSYTSFNTFGAVTTYTGSGVMFTGLNAAFSISLCTISAPTASQVFDFSESVGGAKIFTCDTVIMPTILKVGTFDKMLAVQFLNSSSGSVTDGITIAGNSTVVFSIDKVSLISTSSSFVGVDIGTSVIINIEIVNLICVAPASAIGISGVASSANVPAGLIAFVGSSSFTGGMTDLQNITENDVRWDFIGNSPTPDTIKDALLSFNGNATETVISTINTPVVVNATWTCVRESLFTCTTGGRITSLSERNVVLPIDVSIGVISAGGGSIDVTVYVTLNGSVVADSAVTIAISGSNQAFITIPWQLDLSENDFIEVYLENNTNTTNIIAESAKLRAR